MTAPHQRTARSGGDLRVLRAAVFAAVCVALAEAGHGLASCATVPLWTLGAGFVAVFAVTAPLTGRERTLPGIAAVLAAGQAVLHTLFGLGQQSHTAVVSMTSASMPDGMSMSDASLVERAARLVGGTTAATITPAHAQRILANARLDTADTGMAAMPHHADAVSTAGSSMSVLPSLPMLLGHVLAAVAAGWVLRRGDLALLRLIRLSAHATLVRSLPGALSLVRALRTGLPGAPEPDRALRAPPCSHRRNRVPPRSSTRWSGAGRRPFVTPALAA